MKDFWSDFLRDAFVGTYLLTLSYYAGTMCPRAQADYEAACLFKDVINCARDCDGEFGRESQNLYDEFTMDWESLNFQYLREQDLEEYSWGY